MKKLKKRIIKESSIDFSKIDTYINEKKYLELHNIISKVRVEDLSKEEQVFYYKSKEALEANGVDYLYKREMESIIIKNMRVQKVI